MHSQQNLDLARKMSLASMLTSYPDDDLRETLGTLPHDLRDLSVVQAVERWLAQHDSDLDELRGEYLETFDRGRDRIPLYETEYGRMRGAGKGNDLTDISGCYCAFGLELQGDEMLDHICVELEFYALLLAKLAVLSELGDQDGMEVVAGAMRTFLRVHLGTFVSSMAERTRTRSDIYGVVLEWMAELVLSECTRLECQVEPLDYFSEAELDGPPRCAHERSLPVIQ